MTSTTERTSSRDPDRRHHWRVILGPIRCYGRISSVLLPANPSLAERIRRAAMDEHINRLYGPKEGRAFRNDRAREEVLRALAK